MSDDVREVKSRMDIAELIGDYVELRRRGSSLKGLCPFHSEKTPSFTVSPDRQTFHCFGCGKGGDVFTFLMEMEGLSFREALDRLAQRTGVKLSRVASAGSAASRKESALILEEAEEFFKNSLLGAGGASPRHYLERRGLAREECLRFGIGWGPQSWDALLTHMRKAGFTDGEIVNSGLAGQGDKGLYDRFRGRVIFPVRDETGKIRGFGGRLIDGEGAKYVNSPEGELFNKRKLLYLMHAAKKTIRERGRVILTEGYMDAIRCHVSGFTETVASLGTALTEEQAALIKRFTDLCYMVYDSDNAGQEASIRGMYILQRRGVDVRIVSLTEGKDPDELLSGEGGADLFSSLLKKALPLPLYHVFIRQKALRTPGKSRAAREDVLTGLAGLPALDIQQYIPKIAERFGVLQHQLEREIELRRRKAANSKSAIYEEGNEDNSRVYINSGENIDEEGGKTREADLECAVCSILWHDEELRSMLSQGDVVPFITDEAVAGAVSALLSGESPEELEMRWRALGETGCPARIARGDAILADGGLGPDHAPKMIETLRRKALTRRYDELKDKSLRGEATKDEIAEKDNLAKKIKGNVGA
ncbi:MAG: DNA primase [Synergistaceae bacterium]|jgi:DNA primase|nr:DNA primase [Synergistaceae bacterium]